MEKEKIKNYYTAIDDKQALSVRQLKEILNEVPEDQLDFEVVMVAKIKEELRGIPISNVILDDDGKQLTIFNFLLRQQLRDEALMAMIQAKQNETQEGTTDANAN